MKKLAWMLATALVLTTLCVGATAENLGGGVLTADANGVIALTHNVAISETISLAAGKNYTVQGNGFTLSHAAGHTGEFFEVPATTTLTVNNLIIDAGNNWTLDATKWEAAKTKSDAGNRVTKDEVTAMISPSGVSMTGSVFAVTGGSVTLTNTTIRNMYTTNTSKLFWIRDGGSVSLNSGVNIQHCASTNYSNRGLVANIANGSMTMGSGCTIEDMFDDCNGAMFDLEGNANLTMNGATIRNVKTVNSNGQLAMIRSNSTFTMNSGVVENFVGLAGTNNPKQCIIYNHGHGGKFVMNGGTIRNNVIGNNGVVDASYSNADFVELNAGSIVGNVTNRAGSTSYSVVMQSKTKLGRDFQMDQPVLFANLWGAILTDEGGNHGDYLLAYMRNGNTYYGRLDSAVDAAKSGDTIKLLKDSKTNPFMLKDKTVTLDLNGKTITAADPSKPLGTIDGGVLYVTDSTRLGVSGQGGAGQSSAGYPGGGSLVNEKGIAQLPNNGQLILLTYEGPLDGDGSGAPRTGDETPLALLLAAMAFSGAVLLLSRKRKAAR